MTCFAWSGSPTHGNDRNRSLDVALLASAFVDLDPCSFTLVSLQRDTTAIEQALVRRRAGWVDAGPELEDFADSAALMANLDLIISVDSAVCHLAGALGRPVWTLLPFAADWRWLQQRSDSPWYPGMRLLRQPAPGDWPAVLDALRLALGNWAAA